MKGEREARVKLNLGDQREGANPRCGGVTVTMMVARPRCPRLEGGRSRTTLSDCLVVPSEGAISCPWPVPRHAPWIALPPQGPPEKPSHPLVMRWTALQLSDGFLP